MLLNYQGRLLDAVGNPRNGAFTMQFAIYGSEVGGSALPASTPWGETQTVTVTDGTFNVLLGSVTPLPNDIFNGPPADASGSLRYLQVTVDSEVLAPRRRVVSAAYGIESRGLIMVDANGQTVGEVLALEYDSVQVVATVNGHLFNMFVSEAGITHGGFYFRLVQFESNDCSGQPYLRREPGSLDYLAEIPDVALGPPGITAYVPDSSTEVTLTMNSSVEPDGEPNGGCNVYPSGFTAVFLPATAVPLVDAPGARWTRPFRVIRR